MGVGVGVVGVAAVLVRLVGIEIGVLRISISKISRGNTVRVGVGVSRSTAASERVVGIGVNARVGFVIRRSRSRCRIYRSRRGVGIY